MPAFPRWFQYGPTTRTWIATDQEDQVVGLALVSRHFAHSAEPHLLLVDGQHHGKGISTALVRAVEQDARERGVRLLEVKTRGGVPRRVAYYSGANHFYERLGFLPVEELELWGPGNPCLVLVKPL